MGGSVSMETSALKYTCPHVELACSSMSISVPVHSTTYKRLSYLACPSCAIFMAQQVLEGLESTYPRAKIGKSGSECSVYPTSSEDTTSPTKTLEKHLDALTLVTPPTMKQAW